MPVPGEKKKAFFVAREIRQTGMPETRRDWKVPPIGVGNIRLPPEKAVVRVLQPRALAREYIERLKFSACDSGQGYFLLKSFFSSSRL
jgi:hypothetical protein